MSLPTRYILVPDLETTEDAILAQLRADPSLSTYLQDAATFSGSVEEALSGPKVRLPAALVLYGGHRTEELGPLRYQHTCEWFVLVLCRSFRSEDARRRPELAAEAGAYRMVQDVEAALTLQDLGLDGLGPLVPQGAELVVSGTPRSRSLIVYQVAFTATHELVPTPATQDLERVTLALSTPDPEDGGQLVTVLEGRFPPEP